ncbi:hypothetical protein ACE1TI_05410 [Alteribacillus sp. JSM 102045]|uniref:hypothetical protein n=1 Tax=Alteribacillus sp. JSM 102045 TaxID=1562101 RepID=UPI0035C24632
MIRHVVLVESDPEDVVFVIELSSATHRKMHQNLWWAAGYNLIAIPFAAGVWCRHCDESGCRCRTNVAKHYYSSYQCPVVTCINRSDIFVYFPGKDEKTV